MKTLSSREKITIAGISSIITLSVLTILLGQINGKFIAPLGIATIVIAMFFSIAGAVYFVSEKNDITKKQPIVMNSNRKNGSAVGSFVYTYRTKNPNLKKKISLLISYFTEIAKEKYLSSLAKIRRSLAWR